MGDSTACLPEESPASLALLSLLVMIGLDDGSGTAAAGALSVSSRWISGSTLVPSSSRSLVEGRWRRNWSLRKLLVLAPAFYDQGTTYLIYRGCCS